MNRLEIHPSPWQKQKKPYDPNPFKPFQEPETMPKWIKKPTQSMSQIIGIICKDCILVASESQGTMDDGRKQFDANKIELVRFKDKWALVALAGGIAAAGRVIQDAGKKAAASRRKSAVARKWHLAGKKAAQTRAKNQRLG